MILSTSLQSHFTAELFPTFEYPLCMHKLAFGTCYSRPPFPAASHTEGVDTGKRWDRRGAGHREEGLEQRPQRNKTLIITQEMAVGVGGGRHVKRPRQPHWNIEVLPAIR